MSMEFKVITPDEVAVAATVEYVYLPGSLGRWACWNTIRP